MIFSKSYSVFPELAKPVLIIAIIFFFGLIMAGVVRHFFIKVEDENPGGSALIHAENKVIELKNLPPSLLQRSLIQTVLSCRYLENEPPVGVIAGDPLNISSIKMLSEDERKKFKENEHNAILEHQKKAELALKQIDASLVDNSKKG